GDLPTGFSQRLFGSGRLIGPDDLGAELFVRPGRRPTPSRYCPDQIVECVALVICEKRTLLRRGVRLADARAVPKPSGHILRLYVQSTRDRVDRLRPR